MAARLARELQHPLTQLLQQLEVTAVRRLEASLAVARAVLVGLERQV